MANATIQKIERPTQSQYIQGYKYLVKHMANANGHIEYLYFRSQGAATRAVNMINRAVAA